MPARNSLVVQTNALDSRQAGDFLGRQIATAFDGEQPDALIVFASPQYDARALLKYLDAACRPRQLVGCSSAGEFSSTTSATGTACAVALRASPGLQFSAAIGHGLRAREQDAAREIVSMFRGVRESNLAHRAALVLTDALAGHADLLVEQLTLLTAGGYKLFGGGAGDDASFKRTEVFFGTETYTDAAVALEILSSRPVGVGVRHGWTPATKPMRVTAADGMTLISLDAMPAVEVFQEYAESTGQRFDTQEPIPFFLHNILGIRTNNEYLLRVPLAVNPDGSIACAAEIPSGATVAIMKAADTSSTEAAEDAARDAIDQLGGLRPQLAFFFDCVATRLRLGRNFGSELEAVERTINPAPFAGFNSHGQIARAEGQFSGFHNCTAVVCVLPEP